jgi:hypothetical protein
MIIQVMKKGKTEGYVKSINYNACETKLTDDKSNAKKYSSEDKVHYDIDFLSKVYGNSEYVFIYE